MKIEKLNYVKSKTQRLLPATCRLFITTRLHRFSREIVKIEEVREQRSENRGQRTEVREQRTESREQRAENREQRTEVREQKL